MAKKRSWGPSFKVSLELYINSFDENWAEVLRLTNTENDFGGDGDRIPAIFARRTDADKKGTGTIGIRTQIGDNHGEEAYNKDGILEKKWYTLELTQYKDNNDDKVKLILLGQITKLWFYSISFLIPVLL